MANDETLSSANILISQSVCTEEWMNVLFDKNKQPRKAEVFS